MTTIPSHEELKQEQEESRLLARQFSLGERESYTIACMIVRAKQRCNDLWSPNQSAYDLATTMVDMALEELPENPQGALTCIYHAYNLLLVGVEKETADTE